MPLRRLRHLTQWIEPAGRRLMMDDVRGAVLRGVQSFVQLCQCNCVAPPKPPLVDIHAVVPSHGRSALAIRPVGNHQQPAQRATGCNDGLDGHGSGAAQQHDGPRRVRRQPAHRADASAHIVHQRGELRLAMPDIRRELRVPHPFRDVRGPWREENHGVRDNTRRIRSATARGGSEGRPTSAAVLREIRQWMRCGPGTCCARFTALPSSSSPTTEAADT